METAPSFKFSLPKSVMVKTKLCPLNYPTEEN